MEQDLTVQPEMFRKYVDVFLTYVNRAVKQVRHLLLVEDLVDSLKVTFIRL